MNGRMPIGLLVVLAAVVLQVVSRRIETDTVRLILSGTSAVLAVGGIVMIWQERRPPPKPDDQD